MFSAAIVIVMLIPTTVTTTITRKYGRLNDEAELPSSNMICEVFVMPEYDLGHDVKCGRMCVKQLNNCFAFAHQADTRTCTACSYSEFGNSPLPVPGPTSNVYTKSKYTHCRFVP